MTLLIVEDSLLIVDRIRNNIAEINNFEVIGDVPTVKEEEHLIQMVKQDIIILNIHLQERS